VAPCGVVPGDEASDLGLRFARRVPHDQVHAFRARDLAAAEMPTDRLRQVKDLARRGPSRERILTPGGNSLN
jgi:hypothetical protein